jgi:hypothetical protein
MEVHQKANFLGANDGVKAPSLSVGGLDVAKDEGFGECNGTSSVPDSEARRRPSTFPPGHFPITMDVGLVEALCDYSRPVFLFGARLLPLRSVPARPDS